MLHYLAYSNSICQQYFSKAVAVPKPHLNTVKEYYTACFIGLLLIYIPLLLL